MGKFSFDPKGIINNKLEQIANKYTDKKLQEQEIFYKKTRQELLTRLNKSREYRIMLRDYQKELIEREDAIKQKELELDKQREDLFKDISKDVMKMQAEVEKDREQLKAYHDALCKTELTIIDWIKRKENDDISVFNEMSLDVEKFLRYANQISNMDGFQFEEYVASILKGCDFENVNVTQKSQDFGADIVASKDGVKYVIQCKYYKNPVGIEAVQQIYSAKMHYKAHVSVVATNSVFTKAAKTLAGEIEVVLWDGEHIEKMKSNSEAKTAISQEHS